MKRTAALFGLVAATMLAAGPSQAADDWPTKPIELVISFSPGGGMDQTMLPLKPLMEKALGQPIVFNYKPGAGGRIGFEYVYMHGDDGYTIGALSQPHFTNSVIFDKPRYAIDDMTPVGIIGDDVPIWFVRKDSPYKTLNDLIEAARAKPNEITVATGSFTGEQYLSLAILEQKEGIQFRAVNVQGGGPVMSNVLGGHFDVGISRPASIGGIADEIRGIAVLAGERNEIFPDTPTFDEQLPADIRIPHFNSSRGLMVKTTFAKEHPEAFKKLVDALDTAVHSDEYKAALDRMGFPLHYLGPDEAKAEIDSTAEEMAKYVDLVNDAKTRK